MRSLRSAAALALFVASAPVFAQSPDQDADALVEEGNQLGASGKYAEAIEKFRAADRLVQRPIHACNIGLAYVRLTLWAPAHYYLTRCQRTMPSAELPTWVDRRVKESEAALQSGNFAPLVIQVEPAEARINVAPFPGEAVEAGSTLWLPFGEHTVEVQAEGYQSRTERVLLTEKRPRDLQVQLEIQPARPTEARQDPAPVAAGSQEPSPTSALPPPMPPPLEPRSKAFLYSGIGVSALGVGLVIGGFVFRSKAQGAANEAGDPASYEGESPSEAMDHYSDLRDDVDGYNALAVSMWIGGGVTLAAGGALITYYLLGGSETEQQRLSVSPTPGGANVSLGWTF